MSAEQCSYMMPNTKNATCAWNTQVVSQYKEIGIQEKVIFFSVKMVAPKVGYLVHVLMIFMALTWLSGVLGRSNSASQPKLSVVEHPPLELKFECKRRGNSCSKYSLYRDNNLVEKWQEKQTFTVPYKEGSYHCVCRKGKTSRPKSESISIKALQKPKTLHLLYENKDKLYFRCGELTTGNRDLYFLYRDRKLVKQNLRGEDITKGQGDSTFQISNSPGKYQCAMKAIMKKNMWSWTSLSNVHEVKMMSAILELRHRSDKELEFYCYTRSHDCDKNRIYRNGKTVKKNIKKKDISKGKKSETFLLAYTKGNYTCDCKSGETWSEQSNVKTIKQQSDLILEYKSFTALDFTCDWQLTCDSYALYRNEEKVKDQKSDYFEVKYQEGNWTCTGTHQNWTSAVSKEIEIKTKCIIVTSDEPPEQ